MRLHVKKTLDEVVRLYKRFDGNPPVELFPLGRLISVVKHLPSNERHEAFQVLAEAVGRR
jgi:hypothetical protein